MRLLKGVCACEMTQLAFEPRAACAVSVAPSRRIKLGEQRFQGPKASGSEVSRKIGLTQIKTRNMKEGKGRFVKGPLPSCFSDPFSNPCSASC